MAFAALGLFLGVIRWAVEPTHASGDAFWYARLALEYRGLSDAGATQLAADFIVDQGRGDDPAAYVELVRSVDARYPAIFASRPIYPLIVAGVLSIANLGTAMALAALLAGIAFAVAFGWFICSVTGSLVAAAGGVLLAFVLPSGKWFAFMYADGWMLVFLVLALALATRYVLDRRVWHLICAMAAVGMLYLTKPANGAALVIGLVIIAIVGWASRLEGHERLSTVGAAAGAVGLAQVAVFAVIGLPGLETTLQDMFTVHFSAPDVDNLVVRVLSRDLDVIGMAVSLPFREPVTMLVIAALVVPLVTRQQWAWMWLSAGSCSILVVLAHPVTSEIPRLLAPIWIVGALGGALWIARIRSSRMKRLATAEA
jgi:hypothetical protein